MSATAEEKAERLRSSVEMVPAAEAPTRTTAAKKASTRKILSGSVPVAELLAGDTGDSGDSGNAGGSASHASVRTASASTSVLQAVDASGSQVVSAMDTGSSTSGDYTATPLLSSGSWSAGSSSGAFTYGYQVQVPESAGGLTPKVNLSYSSQSVDGRTSATNNQASWIGDGWDYNPGSITRTYATCREDSKKPGSNNATHRTADMCWGSNNVTLSLGGMTTELVWEASATPRTVSSPPRPRDASPSRSRALPRRGRADLLRGELHRQGPGQVPHLVRHPGRPPLPVGQEMLERGPVVLDP
ncbi:hypothetical protein [Streptomyces sp. NRRL F-5135]|uniref:hypothetical protein n=1 Tax=Streptomyces sp. NRRL F-5135 TaxID=1463858 RepID=UPI0004C57A09